MRTEIGNRTQEDIKGVVADCLSAVDLLDFSAAEQSVAKGLAIIAANRTEELDEVSLNELAVLGFYLGFFENYVVFWKNVIGLEYEPSWMALQDALDSLRTVKRLSEIDVSFFENQLLGLESTYPYKMFSSIGAIAERIECSICSNDIDSSECPHRAGELYGGKMACRIIRKFRQLNHLAVVDNPRDRRCILKVSGQQYQFPAIDWLAYNLIPHSMVASDLLGVRMTERKRPNPDYVPLGRNDRCYCGSGRKFKNCCCEKRYIINPHSVFHLRPGCRAQNTPEVNLEVADGESGE